MNVKKLFITTMAVAFAANVATAYAQERGDRERGARGGNVESKVERIMNKFDTDDSGTITLDEWLVSATEKAENKFNRIDADEDGLISLEEYLAVGSERSDDSDIDRDAVRQCVADATGDIVEERPDRETRFDTIDTNDDGFIDLDEAVASQTESATARFNNIDANGDGAITSEELTAALEARSELRDIRRNCVDEQRDTEELLGE